MTRSENLEFDIEEIRQWLIEHKRATGISWTTLAKRTGLPAGTISQFGSDNKYKGDETRIANAIASYRQGLTNQAELAVDLPEVPSFIATETSQQMLSNYRWAHRGRMCVIATGPGTGKTESAKHYRECLPNVWLTTVTPSTSGVNTMQVELLRAMGERHAKGTPQALSTRIRDRVEGSKGLIIFDEAQHLSEKAIEEIRSWYDLTGIGIVLQGNADVIARLEGGSRRAVFAQLYSRVAMRLVRNLPLQNDAAMIAEAWKIEDARQIQEIVKISQRPGGLRGVTMTLELASMLASVEQRAVSLSDIQDAWTQLSSRPVL